MDVLRYLVVFSLSHGIIFAVTRSTMERMSSDCKRVYFPQSSGVVESFNFPFHYKQHLECRHFIMASHIYPRPCQICFTFSAFHTIREGDCLEFNDGLTNKYIYDGYGYLKATEKLSSGSTEDDTPVGPTPGSDHLWYRNFCWVIHQEYFQLTFKTSNGSPAFNNQNNSQIGRFYATYRISGTDTNITQNNGENEREFESSEPPPLHMSTQIITSDQVPCFHNEWPCFNRHCIQGGEVCNSVDDCGDNSDESYKHTNQCGIGGFSACDLTDTLFPGESCDQTLQYSRFENHFGQIHPFRGPTKDHTQSFSRYVRSNAFLATQFIDNSNTTAYAEIRDDGMPPLYPNKTYCFSFWYHMYGPDPGQLSVYTESLLEQPLWIRHGNYQDIWHHGEMFLPPTNDLAQPEKLLFRAKMGSDVKTSMALDDFNLYQGNCQGDDVSCTFELSTCGWEAIETGWDATFIRFQGAGRHGYGPHGDKSSDNSGGTYLYSFHGPQLWRFTASLLSPPLTIFDGNTIDGCLTFWIFCNGTNSLTFDWYSVDGMGNELLQDSTRLCRRNSWTHVEQNIWSNEPIKIRLAFTDNGLLNSAAVAVDSISVLPGHCNDYVFGSCKLGDFRCWSGPCIPDYRACDGIEDCTDGSDESNETCCQCSPGYFCCRDWNSTCINETLVCNGFPDCPSGADERPSICRTYYRSLSIGIVVAILMIGGVSLAIIIIALVKCIKWIIKKDCTHTNQRTSAQDAQVDLELGSYNSETVWDSPPTYADAVDNPAYMPPCKENCQESNFSPPPEYEKILKGEFTELFWPTKAELEQLRQDTLKRFSVSPGEASEPYDGEVEDSGHPRADDIPSTSGTVRRPSTAATSSSHPTPPKTAIMIDKEAIRRVLRGSLRKRTHQIGNQPRIGPMITIKIYTQSGSSNNQNSPRNVPVTGEQNNAYVDTEQPSTSQGNAELSQTQVDIKLIGRDTADFAEVTVQSSSADGQLDAMPNNCSNEIGSSTTVSNSCGNEQINTLDAAELSVPMDSNVNNNTNNESYCNRRNEESTFPGTMSEEGTEPAIPNIVM